MIGQLSRAAHHNKHRLTAQVDHYTKKNKNIFLNIDHLRVLGWITTASISSQTSEWTREANNTTVTHAFITSSKVKIDTLDCETWNQLAFLIHKIKP